jgi:hypothetical protein
MDIARERCHLDFTEGEARRTEDRMHAKAAPSSRVPDYAVAAVVVVALLGSVALLFGAFGG